MTEIEAEDDIDCFDTLSLEVWLLEVQNESRLEWPYYELGEERFDDFLETSSVRRSSVNWSWGPQRTPESAVYNSIDRLALKYRRFIRHLIHQIHQWESNQMPGKMMNFDHIMVTRDFPDIHFVAGYEEHDLYGALKKLVKRVLKFDDVARVMQGEEPNVHTNHDLQDFFNMIDFLSERSAPLKYLCYHSLLLSSDQRHMIPINAVEVFKSKYGLRRNWIQKFQRRFPHLDYKLSEIVGNEPIFVGVLNGGTYPTGSVDLWWVLLFAKNSSNHIHQHGYLYENQVERQLRIFFPDLLHKVFRFLMEENIDPEVLLTWPGKRNVQTPRQNQTPSANLVPLAHNVQENHPSSFPASSLPIVCMGMHSYSDYTELSMPYGYDHTAAQASHMQYPIGVPSYTTVPDYITIPPYNQQPVHYPQLGVPYGYTHATAQAPENQLHGRDERRRQQRASSSSTRNCRRHERLGRQ